MWKECNVVMLSTNEKAIENNQLYLSEDSKPMRLGLTLRSYTKAENFNKIGQHLYITSDEKIKEMDWYYLSFDNSINLASPTFMKGLKTNCFKIIATTDKSLKFGEDISGVIRYKSLPTPSSEWIQYYISEYNKGNVITKVMVEYMVANIKEYIDEQDAYGYDNFVHHLKVNSDNTINIKSAKTSWSREEVIEFAKLLKGTSIDRFNEDNINQWIEENI